MPEINEIKNEYKKLLEEISNPELISNWKKFEQLSKRKTHLEKILEKEKEIQDLKKEIEENKEIISASDEPELALLAEEELKTLMEKQKVLEKELDSLLKNKSEFDHDSVIVEIRAGTGGEEAALFAADLFRMYTKFGQLQGWKQVLLDSSPSDLGGFKEVIFELKNGDVFSKMKYEGGVHRIQRIPVTEKSNRIHTSTASVAILPTSKTSKIKINPRDLKIDFFNSSGPGGQNVNKRKTAVRLTYLPTGLTVTSRVSRNQQENKEFALSILEARLMQQKQQMFDDKISGERRSQIKGAKRSEKIRTYNFPQDRVTDHRIKKSWHRIEKILDGDLGKIVADLQSLNVES
jgi:peptide chain release factor 1